MNINQWIEDLNQADPPNESPALFDQRGGQDGRPVRKRRRGSGRSSPLQPFAEPSQPTEKHAVSVYDLDSDASSATETNSSSSVTSSSSVRYWRRPRHRTKAEKYLPKLKSTPQPREKQKKRHRRKQRRRKSKKHEQNKSEKITGIVQSFHAKNISNKRLTLDSSNKVGLYTKGRSSVPIRGKGLPDLVFSEMRFLQKSEPAAGVAQEKTSKKKHSKKRRELSEEEISRYFDLGKRDQVSNQGPKKQVQPVASPRSSRAAQRVQTALAVELPEKPFLGFGTRGSHPPTTSYHTWSDSGKASTSAAEQVGPSLEPLTIGQLQGGYARQKRPETINAAQDTVQHSLADDLSKETHVESVQVELPSEHRKSADLSKQDRHPPEREVEITFDPHSKEFQSPKSSAEYVVDQEDANVNRIHMDPSANAATSCPLNNTIADQTVAVRPKRLKQHDREWHPSLVDELLQDCALVARNPTPVYHEHTGLQKSLDGSHDYTDLQLWRADEEYGPEYNGQDDMRLMSTRDYLGYPEAVEQRGDQLLAEDVAEDYSSDSLDSQFEYGCYLPIGAEVRWGDGQWEEAVPGGLRDRQDYQLQKAEGIEELGSFWQPNRLY